MLISCHQRFNGFALFSAPTGVAFELVACSSSSVAQSPDSRPTTGTVRVSWRCAIAVLRPRPRSRLAYASNYELDNSAALTPLRAKIMSALLSKCSSPSVYRKFLSSFVSHCLVTPLNHLISDNRGSFQGGTPRRDLQHFAPK